MILKKDESNEKIPLENAFQVDEFTIKLPKSGKECPLDVEL